jgi:hypothetical protein
MTHTKIIALVSVAALAIGVWAYSQAAEEEIRACVNFAGIPCIIKSGECRRGETLLTWNKQGIQGKKVENAMALIWKLLRVAESTFRRLKGAALLPAVYAGGQYVDGVQRPLSPRQPLAA